MSRISRTPVVFPEGVKHSLQEGKMLTVEGAKGKLDLTIHDALRLEVDGQNIFVRTKKSVKQSEIPKDLSMLCGTYKRLIQNMVTGVSEGFSKTLELVGVGYRAEYQPQNARLKLSLGFSHDIFYPIPQGIEVAVEKATTVKISGIDKQQVGQIAAEIRKFRPPEPYKGKGVRLAGEFVRRKEGKAK